MAEGDSKTTIVFACFAFHAFSASIAFHASFQTRIISNLMQYTKEQLSGMSVDELRKIADEFGIKTAKLEPMDIVYEILDKSAIASAADKAAKQTTTGARKRTRIKTVDRVYSATQDKAKKVDKTMKVSVDDSLFASLSDEEKKMIEQAKIDEQAAEAQKTSVEEQKPAEASVEAVEPSAEQAPKKRGRKKKEEPAAPAEVAAETAEAPAAPAEAPKKRGRKSAKAAAAEEAPKEDFIVVEMKSADEKAAETPAAPAEPALAATSSAEQPVAQPAPVAGSARTLADVPLENGSDFIIIDDIPAEEYVVGRNILDIIKGASNKVNANMQQNNQRNGNGNSQNDLQPKEKAYDFGDILTVCGVFEMVDNYGFLRSADYNYLVSPDDVYVSQSQVKQFGLKTGDVVEGTTRPPKDGEKFFPLINIKKINGCNPTVIRDRVSFEYLTPLFPDEKFNLCSGDMRDTPSSRTVDLFAPIGKGQRALIVAQPKTGKTLLMKDIANSIARNHPDAYLMMLLIDERPEEVTDMARTVKAEVIASTFDAPAENHVKIAGLVLEKAKRMVECGHDVVIFLDSITRLARAYNTVSPASGKVLSGGVDANALQKPKRFFGAARNIENGGSLTIIATALIDTGSKMDEVIFEEFKGTGNMELQLDRSLSNKRIFPAVNLVASSTRRDDLLQDQTTLNRMWILRKHISDMTPVEAMDFLLQQIQNTKNNDELLLSMNG